jgi:hypothetical protein
MTIVGLKWAIAVMKRARPPAVVSPLMLALVDGGAGTKRTQSLSEQGRPALADGDAKTGGEAVAVDQNALFGRRGMEAGQQQDKQATVGEKTFEHDGVMVRWRQR